MFVRTNDHECGAQQGTSGQVEGKTRFDGGQAMGLGGARVGIQAREINDGWLHGKIGSDDLHGPSLAFGKGGAQGLVAILSELLLVIYVVVLTVMAVMKIVKTRGS